jgi:hypothetical protein
MGGFPHSGAFNGTILRVYATAIGICAGESIGLTLARRGGGVMGRCWRCSDCCVYWRIVMDMWLDWTSCVSWDYVLYWPNIKGHVCVASFGA